MNVVGKVGSLISQGVYSVATPFHPFGGAVDVIVVQQQDGTFRCTPWYVRFGKFQGVLKGSEKIVRINVNGLEANFHMYLDNSGEAYFVKEVDDNDDKGMESNGIVKDPNSGHRIAHSVSDLGALSLEDEGDSSDVARLKRVESKYYDFQDEQSYEDSVELFEYGSNPYESLHGENYAESHPEMVLVSVDGHVLTAPISQSEQDTENVQLVTPQFHLGPAEGIEFSEGNAEFISAENAWTVDYTGEMDASAVEIRHEEGLHIQQAQETLMVQSQDQGPCIQANSVEVSEQNENADLLDKDSSLGTKNLVDEATTNRPVVDENEPVSLAQTECNGELSPADASESFDSHRLLELRLQELEKKASGEVDTGCDNDDVSKGEHISTQASIEGLDDSQQIPAHEDYYSKRELVEPQTTVSNQGGQIHSGLSKIFLHISLF